MKIEFKTCAKIAGCVFALYLAIIYWESFAKFAGVVIGAASPLFIGAAIAYVVNLLMSFYERKLKKKKKNPKVLKVKINGGRS